MNEFKDGCTAYVSPDLSWPDGCDLFKDPLSEIMKTQLKRLDDWIRKMLIDYSAEDLRWVAVESHSHFINPEGGKYTYQTRYKMILREEPLDYDKAEILYKEIHEGKSNLMDI